MYHSIRDSTRGRVLIRFGTYNIRNGGNGGLDFALRGMSQAHMGLSIFKEKKRTNGVNTRRLSRYSVVSYDAPIRHRGGVAFF